MNKKIAIKEFEKKYLDFLLSLPSWSKMENEGKYAVLNFDNEKKLYLYCSGEKEDILKNKKLKYFQLEAYHIRTNRDDTIGNTPKNIYLSYLKNAYYNNNYRRSVKKYIEIILDFLINKNNINIVFNPKLFAKSIFYEIEENLETNQRYSKNDILFILIKKYIKVNKEDLIKTVDYILKYHYFKKINEDEYIYIDEEENEEMESNNKIKNIILYGSPGVGKTHNINKLLDMLDYYDYSENDIFTTIKENAKENIFLDEELKNRVKFITFHQSFGYEDFIEGFRPNKEGQIELIDGVFKAFVKKADKNRDENYYLIIDEINRSNISKIFGELITLIEEDKRDKLTVTLQYSKEPFSVPSNLYIIGTMNSTDKSIALIDIALRRRFTFLKLEPNENLIDNEEARELIKKLNDYIEQKLGNDYKIGHSYFMGDIDLDFVKRYKIEPLLEEYFYGDSDGFKESLEILNQ